MVKPNLRTKSIGTKVSEEEFARLEQTAQKASKTLGGMVPRGDPAARSRNGIVPQKTNSDAIDGLSLTDHFTIWAAIRDRILTVLYE